MPRLIQQLICLLLTGVFIATSICIGKATEIEAQVTSVDAQSKTIIVAYKAALGKTTARLEVSKKAKIEINGKLAFLGDLKPGHKVIVDYYEELAVITTIQASGDPKVPEFMTMQELNGSYGSLTEDGQLIAYEVYDAPNSNGPMLFMAHRKNTESYFQEPKQLFPGRHPAISGDGLEIVFLGKTLPAARKRTLYSTRRDSIEQQFRRAKEIRELKAYRDPKSPFLSPDGLTLCFRNTGKNSQLLVTTRKDRNSSWDIPRLLVAKSVEEKLKGHLVWSWLSTDGLTLIAAVKGSPAHPKNLLLMKRKDKSEVFVEYEFLQIEGIPSDVRCPRYLPKTQELFVAGHPKEEPIFQIGAIKNYQLP